MKNNKHVRRLKEFLNYRRRLKKWGRLSEIDDRKVKAAYKKQSVPCSCSMCDNHKQGRYWKDKKHDREFKEELSEINGN